MTEELDGPTRRGPTRAHAPPRPFRVPLNPVNAQSFAALPARGQAVEHLKDSRSRSAHPGRARLLARIQRGERNLTVEVYRTRFSQSAPVGGDEVGGCIFHLAGFVEVGRFGPV